MIKKNDKIFVAGHKGLIGAAIVKQLKLKGYNYCPKTAIVKLIISNSQHLQNKLSVGVLFFGPEFVIH